MSLREELAAVLDGLDGVKGFAVEKNVEAHGEPAVEVKVILADNRVVVGTFTTEAKSGFGGVEFDSRKNIPQLMRAKVEAVLSGVAEEAS